MTTPPGHDEQNHTPLCRLAMTKFEEMDRRIEQRFKAIEATIQKTEHLMNMRLESMNAFRDQILEERANFATRRESALITLITSVVVAVIAVVLTYLVRK